MFTLLSKEGICGAVNSDLFKERATVEMVTISSAIFLSLTFFGANITTKHSVFYFYSRKINFPKFRLLQKVSGCLATSVLFKLNVAITDPHLNGISVRFFFLHRSGELGQRN